MSKTQFAEVLEYVKDDLESGRRCSKLAPSLKLAIALRFYATGAYQRTLGEEYMLAVSQKAASNAIEEVTPLLEAKLCQVKIKFPQTAADKQKIKERFYNKTGFPGIIGCIDGTHVSILKPVANEHLYIDRFGKHSINVQLVMLFK